VDRVGCLFSFFALFLFCTSCFAGDAGYETIIKMYDDGKLHTYDGGFHRGTKIANKLSDYTASLTGNRSDLSIHWGVATWAVKNKQYGLAMYALKRAWELDHKDLKVSYNMGVLFILLGLKEPGLARLRFVSGGDNFLLKNRATALIMRVEDGGQLDESFLLLAY